MLLIAASILAARKLAQWNGGKKVPATRERHRRRHAGGQSKACATRRMHSWTPVSMTLAQSL